MIRAPLCLWLCLSALLANNVAAQMEPVKPCPTPAYRAFDFWLGEWEVKTLSGQLAGYNTITQAEQGCLLTEQWRGVQGASGQSMNF